MTKGCHSCMRAKGPYCERPGGSDCNWVGELFRGEQNDWIHWKPKWWVGGFKPAAKPSLADELRRVAADLLDKEAT